MTHSVSLLKRETQLEREASYYSIPAMIPVVDIGCCLVPETEGGDPSAFEETAKLLHDAISEHGFCYLSNHGVTQKALDDLTSASLSFFRQPEDVKRKCFRPPTNYGGWTPFETEGSNPDRPHGDVKETFNYTPFEDSKWLTEEVPDMRRSYEDIFRQCQQLTYRILDLIGLAFEFKDRSFLSKCHQKMMQKGNSTVLRCVYYPPSSDLKDQQIACGEHFDYGTISLVFQDDVGGLQIQGKDGEYYDVTPVPGAVVLNVGGIMERWTAGQYPATEQNTLRFPVFCVQKHRVILPRQAIQENRARHSIVFFIQPDDDVLIECLDGSNKYPPITAWDFLKQLMSKIY